MSVIANDLKKGMAVRKDGDIYVVMGITHRTPEINAHLFKPCFAPFGRGNPRIIDWPQMSDSNRSTFPATNGSSAIAITPGTPS